MRSLEVIKNEDELISYEGVSKYNCQYRNMINNYYHGHKNEHRNEREFAIMLQSQQLPEPDSSIVIERAISDREEPSEVDDKENIRNTTGVLHHSSIVIKDKIGATGKEDTLKVLH